MNNRMQTDAWIYRIVVVLVLITMVSVVGALMMGWPMPELLVALGSVAVAGLLRLLISPLNRGLFK